MTVPIQLIYRNMDKRTDGSNGLSSVDPKLINYSACCSTGRNPNSFSQPRKPSNLIWPPAAPLRPLCFSHPDLYRAYKLCHIHSVRVPHLLFSHHHHPLSQRLAAWAQRGLCWSPQDPNVLTPMALFNLLQIIYHQLKNIIYFILICLAKHPRADLPLLPSM